MCASRNLCLTNRFDSFVLALTLANEVERIRSPSADHYVTQWRLEKFPLAKATLTTVNGNGHYRVSLRIVSRNAIGYNGLWLLDDPTLFHRIVTQLNNHGFISVLNV
jgi:hypothetical protein